MCKAHITNKQRPSNHKMDTFTNFLDGNNVKEQVNEKMKQAFEKRQTGGPMASRDDQRKQYLNWINDGS